MDWTACYQEDVCTNHLIWSEIPIAPSRPGQKRDWRAGGAGVLFKGEKVYARGVTSCSSSTLSSLVAPLWGEPTPLTPKIRPSQPLNHPEISIHSVLHSVLCAVYHTQCIIHKCGAHSVRFTFRFGLPPSALYCLLCKLIPIAIQRGNNCNTKGQQLQYKGATCEISWADFQLTTLGLGLGLGLGQNYKILSL